MVSDCEIERQYRLVRQTLAIHAMLRDDYAGRVLFVESALLVASVVFCATTFAGRELYDFVGVGESTGRIVLGVASVVALACSVTLLRVDWSGLAANHDAAAAKWAETLQIFSEARTDEMHWLNEHRERLNEVYWNTHRLTVPIPDKRFNRCKSRYLLKCEISRRKSDHPGCPRIVLWGMIRLRDSWHAIRSVPRIETVKREPEKSPDGSRDDHAG